MAFLRVDARFAVLREDFRAVLRVDLRAGLFRVVRFAVFRRVVFFAARRFVARFVVLRVERFVLLREADLRARFFVGIMCKKNFKRLQFDRIVFLQTKIKKTLLLCLIIV